MTEGQEFSSVGNIQTAYYGMPRNAYVSVRYNFEHDPRPGATRDDCGGLRPAVFFA